MGSLCNSLTSPVETGCGGMYETRHDFGDGAQLEGLQTQQAPDTEGSTHDWEAGEAAEAGAREKAQAETSGDLHLVLEESFSKWGKILLSWFFEFDGILFCQSRWQTWHTQFALLCFKVVLHHVVK